MFLHVLPKLMLLKVDKYHLHRWAYNQCLWQGCQLSCIERESPASTLFLPLSCLAYQISSIMNISPVKSFETYKISRLRMYT